MKATISYKRLTHLYLLLALEVLIIISSTEGGSSSDNKPVDITFYEHEYFKGQAYKISILPGECINVKQGKTFSSAKIGDSTTCVIFFNADNCRQRPVRFKKGNESKGLDRFANVGANDDIASVKICPVEKSTRG